MTAKLLTASGALGASGANLRMMRMTLSGVGGAGTAVFKTGGASGTNTSITFQVIQNDTVDIDLSKYNIVADYLTLTNAEAMVSLFGDS